MNRNVIWIVGVALLSVTCSKAVAEGMADQDLAVQVDRLFAKWDKADCPGCALGIIRDGKFVHKRCYGMGDLDHSVSVTTDSVFEVGSVAKSFTCVCIALLLDQGRISPDDDIRKYLPEMPKYEPPVSIHHLIQCKSGLPDYYHLMQLAGWNIEDTYIDDDVLALLTRQKSLPFKAGDQFSYSGSDYFLLGIIVKRVTGKSLARFAKESVFEPLGMKRTYFDDDPSRVVRGRVVGYDPPPDGGYRRWMMNSKTVGGWGLKTTVEDLCLWDRNFYENKLPKGKFLNEFFTEGTLLGNRNVLEGTMNDVYKGLKRVRFTGGMPGFLAVMVRFPQQKLTIICLSNTTDLIPFPLVWQIADLYLAKEIKPQAHEVGKVPDKRTFIELREQEVANKVGAYRCKQGAEDGFIVQVEIVDGKLRFTNHFGRSILLVPLSPTRFREAGENANADFQFSKPGKDGRFTLVHVGDDGPTIRFEPVELVKPTKEELAVCAGKYYSDELHSTYRFFVEDGSLFVQVNNRRKEPLFPTVKGEFVPSTRPPDDGRVFTFSFGKGGSVNGLRVRLWRVSVTDFRRLPRP